MTGGIAGGPIWVVAGALRGIARGSGDDAAPGNSGSGDGAGRRLGRDKEDVSKDIWLMHRRPLEKHHGGLWEFPGGKVEDAEIPVKALIRELHEELDISVRARDCIPAGFAEERPPESGPENGVLRPNKSRASSAAGGAVQSDEGGKKIAAPPIVKNAVIGRRPIVILLYTISVWKGPPRAMEGGELGWFTPKQINSLEKPPLDRELVRGLFEKAGK